MLHAFRLADRHLTRTAGPEPETQDRRKPRDPGHFRGGLALDPERKVLYSLDVDARNDLRARSRQPQKELKSAPAGDAALRRRRWPGTAPGCSSPTGPAARCAFSTRTTSAPSPGSPSASIPTRSPSIPRTTGSSSPAHRATASSVIDTRRGIVTETIHTALFPQAPEGSTPDALAVAPDGKTLFVANADNNSVAVIDIATPSRSQVKGFIPTGWYPTAVAVTPDGKQLLIGVGKGNQTKANPIDADEGQAPRPNTHAGRHAADPAVPLHRHHALGLAVDRAGSRRQDAGRVHRDGLQELPLFRQAAHGRPLPRRRPPSPPGWATRRRSSMCSTSSRRIAPTTRSSAT